MLTLFELKKNKAQGVLKFHLGLVKKTEKIDVKGKSIRNNGETSCSTQLFFGVLGD